VIIFDWDDTICPSSFVDQMKAESLHDLPLHFQNIFKEIGTAAEKCLDEAAKFGQVLIVTNSDDGWVKFSAERFVPNLLPCLNRCRIISARTRYERFYPNQPLCWKAAAFAHEVNMIYEASESNKENHDASNETSSMVSSDVSFEEEGIENVEMIQKRHNITKSNGKAWREVISFGDSGEERTAVKIVAQQLEATPKSVMFITAPTPAQIIGQLAMLTSQMEFLCTHNRALDLEISPSQAQRVADELLHFDKTSAVHTYNRFGDLHTDNHIIQAHRRF
jgi:hypothetical protein